MCLRVLQLLRLVHRGRACLFHLRLLLQQHREIQQQLLQDAVAMEWMPQSL